MVATKAVARTPSAETKEAVDRLVVQTRSVLTCPSCGASAEEEMPVDACVYFYECRGCGMLLKPNKGDCCVFCSFGTVKCPPIQSSTSCCAPATHERAG